MTPGIRRLMSDDVDSVVAFSLRAWAPVFDSFLAVLGDRVFYAVYPDWLKIQASAVATICRDDAADVFVAVVDGQVVGFVAVLFHAEGAASCGEVDMLAVDPDHQNTGVGTALTEFAVGHIQTAGAELAVIATGGDAGHAPARRAYEKAGFTPLPAVRYYRSLI